MNKQNTLLSRLKTLHASILHFTAHFPRFVYTLYVYTFYASKAPQIEICIKKPLFAGLPPSDRKPKPKPLQKAE